jgi:hypothetical protein
MSHENEIGLELMNSLLTSGIAMLVAAASDLLPNVRSKSVLWKPLIPDLKSVKRIFLLFSMPIEIVISTIYVCPNMSMKLIVVVDRIGQARTYVPSQTRFYRWHNQC